MNNNFFDTIINKKEPYIIAELGSNHNGDMELAKKLITEAKNAGVDCVKFQSWSKDTIFSQEVYDRNYFLKDDYRNRTDFTLERIVDAFSISEQELYEMKLFSDTLNLDCTSTPFSRKEVDFLTGKFDAKFIKIASMDLNNFPFLEYVASKNKPIVLSTGLSDLDEIDKAVRVIENTGNRQIILLHCISIYPPDDEQVNLKNMETLSRNYNYPVGFSDHSIGTAIPLAAVALGSKVIEKHFTLDKNLFGWDHKVSANLEEMHTICCDSKRIVKSLGNNRIISPENEEQKNAFRRSIVLTKDKNEGDVLEYADIDYKRPGYGIQPLESKYVIGRILKNNVKKDNLLKWEDMI